MELLEKIREIEEKEKTEKSFLKKIEKLGSPYTEMFSFINIKQNGNKVLFKYKDFEKLFKETDLKYHDFWHLYNGLFRECRGLVYDLERHQVVALPFQKFFNIDEQEETSMETIRAMLANAKRVEFSNKLDGTLIIGRWYEGECFSCVSGTLAEEGVYPLEYARKFLKQEHYAQLLKDYEEWTCLFECVSPNNQLVVVYSKEQYGLHLIGMRNVNTGELKPYSEIKQIAEKYQVSVTENYGMTFDEILESRKNFKHTEKEGYVMYLDGTLVKIKCDDYILLHKMMKNNINKNAIIKAIANNTIDDMLASNTEDVKTIIYETIETISEYEKKMDANVSELFKEAPKEKVEFFKWIKTVPKMYVKFLTNKFFNKPYSYLVELEAGESSSYIKYAEIERRLEKL